MDNLPAETRNAILNAIESQQKIEAVKLYKTATGCSLASAKEFIETYRQRENQGRSNRPSGDFAGIDVTEADLILDDIFAGRKLGAIKRYKTASGRSLNESKSFVEDLTERLKKESPDQFHGVAGKGCASSILIIAVAILLAFQAGMILMA